MCKSPVQQVVEIKLNTASDEDKEEVKQVLEQVLQQTEAVDTRDQVWRKDLKVGDMIDVLVFADPRQTHQGYMQGTVMEVKDDLLSIAFLDSVNVYDCSLNRYANEI